MNITTKDWCARVSKMPGLEGSELLVSGVVTVRHSAFETTLVRSPYQDKSSGLRLDLLVEEKGTGLQYLRDITVSYSEPSNPEIAHVTIFYNQQIVARIDTVEVVS